MTLRIQKLPLLSPSPRPWAYLPQCVSALGSGGTPGSPGQDGLWREGGPIWGGQDEQGWQGMEALRAATPTLSLCMLPLDTGRG